MEMRMMKWMVMQKRNLINLNGTTKILKLEIFLVEQATTKQLKFHLIVLKLNVTVKILLYQEISLNAKCKMQMSLQRKKKSL